MYFKVNNKDNLNRILQSYKKYFLYQPFWKCSYNIDDPEYKFIRNICNKVFDFSDDTVNEDRIIPMYMCSSLKSDVYTYDIAYQKLNSLLYNFKLKYCYKKLSNSDVELENIDIEDESVLIFLILYIVHRIVLYLSLSSGFARDTQYRIYKSFNSRFRFLTEDDMYYLMDEAERYESIKYNNANDKFCSPFIYQKDVVNKATGETTRYYRVKNNMYYTVDNINFYKYNKKTKIYSKKKYRAVEVDSKYNIHFMCLFIKDFFNGIDVIADRRIDLFLNDVSNQLLRERPHDFSSGFNIGNLLLLSPELFDYSDRIMHDVLRNTFYKLYREYKVISIDNNYYIRLYENNHAKYYLCSTM